MFRDFVFPEDLMPYLDARPGVDAIIHLGANSSTTATDGDEMIRSNFQFSNRLLDWCAWHRVPLIYASSAATYGDGAAGFVDSLALAELRKLRPLNLYGWSKHQFDLVFAERIEQGLPLPPKCVGLKFFNVFGPNEYHKGDMRSVVAKNFETARRGDTVKLFMSHRNDVVDGGQQRDFIHVDDVVDVVLWCLDAGPSYGLFNVGTGRAATFRELIEALFAAVGRDPAISYVPMPEALRSRYQYFTQASMQALRAAGYDKPFTPVDAAVARYVAYLASADPYR
jgi:ADP-L-glycero-D-manno-heptose 6-epimerase